MNQTTKILIATAIGTAIGAFAGGWWIARQGAVALKSNSTVQEEAA